MASLCATVAALWIPGFVSSAWAQPVRVNLAKYQPCAADSIAAGDPAVYATDGIVGNGNRWKSGSTPPHWLSVTLPLAMPVGSAQLYLGRDETEAHGRAGADGNGAAGEPRQGDDERRDHGVVHDPGAEQPLHEVVRLSCGVVVEQAAHAGGDEAQPGDEAGPEPPVRRW